MYYICPLVTKIYVCMTGLEQVYLKVSPVRTCHGQSHVCQLSWWVNIVRDGSLLHTSRFILLCWHNRNYVPIWTHLNDSVNCELLIRTLIINHFKLCAFENLSASASYEYSIMNTSRFVHCNLIPNHLM